MEGIGMTTWDYAKQEGRQEGIEEGIQKKAIEMAYKLFVNFPNWTDQQIGDFVGLSKDEIRAARKEFVKQQSQKDK